MARQLHPAQPTQLSLACPSVILMCATQTTTAGKEIKSKFMALAEAYKNKAPPKPAAQASPKPSPKPRATQIPARPAPSPKPSPSPKASAGTPSGIPSYLRPTSSHTARTAPSPQVRWAE